jgi:hypothetical protein
VYDTKYTLPGQIEAGETYRLRVQPVCRNGMQAGEFSGWQAITIPTPPTQEELCPECSCEVPQQLAYKLTNFTLRNDLQPGDTIIDNYTRLILVSANPKGNTYEGQLLFWWEFYGVKILCNYKDLQVNTDNQVIDCEYESVYDPTLLADVDAVNELVDAVNTLIQSGDTITVPFEITDTNALNMDCTADTACVVTINGANGESQIITLPKDSTGNVENLPMIIQDNLGKTFTLHENGTISEANNGQNTTANNNSATNTSTIKNTFYYEIKGNRYYSNDIIFLPYSLTNTYTIQAYRNDSTLFYNGSVWNGNVTVVDSATVRFIPNAVSNSINGNVLSTIYTDSLRNDTLQCRLVVFETFFKENGNQKYGFDPNKIPQYNSYHTPYGDGIPYKSFVSNGTDNFILETNPPEVAKYLTLDKGNILSSIIPTNITSNSPVQIQAMANSGGIESSYIFANQQKNNVDTAGILNTVKYPPLTQGRTLKIILVHEENDDVQVIPVGKGEPKAVCIRPGANGKINSRLGGDDQIVFDTLLNDSVIHTGLNGICETTASGDDVQVIPVGNGKAYSIAINSGHNRFRDTNNILGDDTIVGDTVITTGADGICQTTALATNIRVPGLIGTLTAIKDSLNKVYLPAGIEFTSVVLDSMTLNYDLDRDGMLDDTGIIVSHSKAYEIHANSEYTVIRDSIYDSNDIFDYYLVLVKTSKGTNLAGNGSFSTLPTFFRFTFVFYDIHVGQIKTFYNTIIHELGHSAFELSHPFQDHKNALGYYQGRDPDNFMDYQDGFESRKYQWDDIRNNDKILPSKYGK